MIVDVLKPTSRANWRKAISSDPAHADQVLLQAADLTIGYFSGVVGRGLNVIYQECDFADLDELVDTTRRVLRVIDRPAPTNGRIVEKPPLFGRMEDLHSTMSAVFSNLDLYFPDSQRGEPLNGDPQVRRGRGYELMREYTTPETQGQLDRITAFQDFLATTVDLQEIVKLKQQGLSFGKSRVIAAAWPGVVAYTRDMRVLRQLVT